MGKITGAGVSNEPGDDPSGWPEGAVLGGPSRDISPHDPLATAQPAVLESQGVGAPDRSFVHREQAPDSELRRDDDEPTDEGDGDTQAASGSTGTGTGRKRPTSDRTDSKVIRSDEPVTITPAAEQEKTGDTSTRDASGRFTSGSE